MVGTMIESLLLNLKRGICGDIHWGSLTPGTYHEDRNSGLGFSSSLVEGSPAAPQGCTGWFLRLGDSCPQRILAGMSDLNIFTVNISWNRPLKWALTCKPVLNFLADRFAILPILSQFHKVRDVFSEAWLPIVRGVTTNYYHGFDWQLEI